MQGGTTPLTELQHLTQLDGMQGSKGLTAYAWVGEGEKPR